MRKVRNHNLNVMIMTTSFLTVRGDKNILATEERRVEILNLSIFCLRVMKKIGERSLPILINETIPISLHTPVQSKQM